VIAYPDAIKESWLPVAAVQEVGAKPVSRRLHGVPLVIFRSGDSFGVLRDRCPHRNVALSAGRVIDGKVVCPYHGWSFGADGACTHVPGSDVVPKISASTLPVRVAGGLIFTNLSDTPRDFPLIPAPIGDPAYDEFMWPIRAPGFLVDAVENLLDPAHPHYLHPGIVRSPDQRHAVRVEIIERAHSVEAIYHEEARTKAWMPRLLEGKRMTSIGRFFPPTTAQLAFEGEGGPKLVITAFFSPETETEVQAFAHFATPKGRLPARLKEMVLRAFHRPVLRQDQEILKAQVENVERFGSVRYAAGPLDFLKMPMLRLMRGETLEERVSEGRCWL
jgi:phenylpropionate dioxygenase-like ring-hydroxylating dioxygenase large terminal subunit